MDNTAQISIEAMPDLTSTPATPEAAQASLDSLRNDRIAGRVDQNRYLDRVEYLQRVIAGEKVQAIDPYCVTTEQRLERQYSEMMKPAAGHEYEFAYEPGFEHTPQTLAIDRELREAFAGAGIPKHLGGPLFGVIESTSKRFADADEATRQSQIHHVTSQLQSLWGDKFKDRLDAVDELVCDLASRSSAVGELLDESPWFLADVSAMAWLDTIAQHKKRAKG